MGWNPRFLAGSYMASVLHLSLRFLVKQANILKTTKKYKLSFFYYAVQRGKKEKEGKNSKQAIRKRCSTLKRATGSMKKQVKFQ